MSAVFELSGMEQLLAIVGASARAAAQSAHRSGFRCVSADLFCDADLRSCYPALQIGNYPDDLREIVPSLEAEAWLYTGGLENYPKLIDQIAMRCRLLGNSGTVLRLARDPFFLSNLFRDAGLPFPDTVHCWDRCWEDVPRDGSWLKKARRSTGGMQVSVWNEPSTRIHEGDYFQRRVAGKPCSALYVASRGKAVLLGATYQQLGTARDKEKGFCYLGSLGPANLSPSTLATLTRLGEVVAEATKLQGLFGVDFVLDPLGDVWAVEINPRFPASVEVVERVTDMRAIGLHVAACESGHLPSPPRATGFSGKRILFANGDVTIRSEQTDRLLQKNLDSSRPRYADIPAAGTQISAGAPLLTVLADGESLEQVEQQLFAQAETAMALVGLPATIDSESTVGRTR